jgi:hypothetical protein
MSLKHGPCDFANLSGVYYNRPALIMCGGPSLPEQVKQAGEADWVRFSVNEHGVKLTDVDYIVALDNIPEKVHGLGVPVIGFYIWSEYRLCNFWNAGNSGIQAVWCAHAMGCNPIVVAGADCYTNGTYWWDRDANSSGNNSPLPSHLQAWQKLLDHCKSAVIRAVDGPLIEVFGKYEAGVEYDRPEPYAIEEKDWGSIVKPGTLIEFLRSCAVNGEHYEEGTVARLGYNDARQVISIGKARVKEESSDDRDSGRPAGDAEDVRPASDRGRRKRAGAA